MSFKKLKEDFKNQTPEGRIKDSFQSVFGNKIGELIYKDYSENPLYKDHYQKSIQTEKDFIDNMNKQIKDQKQNKYFIGISSVIFAVLLVLALIAYVFIK